MVIIKKGDVFLVNLEPVRGREQGGIRPVLIIQNDVSNKHSPVTIIAAITSRIYSKEFPTNISVPKKDSGLNKDSTIMLNQLRTIDNSRIIKKIGSLNSYLMNRVDMALKISLGLN
jgi:mRNA interferase MazF